MTAKRKTPEQLRSHRWLGVQDLRSFGHRSRLRQMGYDDADWGRRPIIGIVNTWSDINSCLEASRILSRYALSRHDRKSVHDLVKVGLCNLESRTTATGNRVLSRISRPGH
jgi:dihydroxyacid dehydratase/phosphogluconate dehydratase